MLFGLEWLGEISGYKLRSKVEGAIRKARWNSGARGHRPWQRGVLEKAPGGIVPRAAAGGGRRARFSRPSRAQQAGRRTGLDGHSLTWLVTWKGSRKHNEGNSLSCFGARCPSSFQARPYLGLSIQLGLTGLLHNTVQRPHHPLRWSLPGATNTSASSSRPSRPGARRVRGGRNRNIFVLVSLVSIRH